MTRLLIALLLAVASFGATGDILAVRVVGSTTGVADAESACNTASACTGWVAEIDVDNLSTGGTYALGIGALNSPAAAKITCTVTSSGYDATGTLGTTNRTVYGTHQLRNVYNVAYTPPYPNDETLVSTTLTLRVALSDFVYQGDTLTCDVGAGIYTQGGTPTNTATGVSVTNNSTLTYDKARAVAAWSWPGYSRITGSTLTVRAVGFSRHAKDAKPLAAMKFTATDPDGLNVSTTVTDMTIDSGMADAVKVQEYVGTLDVSACSQGKIVTVNFAAYPWVGDATAVMDTSDGVNTQPSPNYAPQHYVCDRLGTYGSPIAVVDASTGSDTNNCAAANGTDPATISPCLTIKGAVIDIRALNVATNAAVHSDVNGTVYLKAGTHAYTGLTTSVTASSGTVADAEWVTITPYPGVDRSNVILGSITSSGNRAGASTVKQKISGVTLALTGTNEFFSSGVQFWLHNNSLLNTSTAAATLTGTAGGVAYWTHNTVATNATCNAGVTESCLHGGFSSFSNSSHAALIRGNNLDNLANLVRFFCVLGNSHTSAAGATGLSFLSSDDSSTVDQSYIFAYNKLMNVQTGTSFLVTTAALATQIGGVLAGNLLELNSSNAATVGVSAGGNTVSSIVNQMSFNNTVIGQRYLYAYNDTGSTPMYRSTWTIRNSVFSRFAVKSDVFSPYNAGRVGNWSAQYGVGFSGNVDAAEATGGQAVGGSLTFAGEWTGLYSNMMPIAATLDEQSTTQPTSVSPGHAVTWLAFTNRTAFDGVSTGAGNGDYHLTGSSPALNLVPSGSAVLPYDLDGVARRNDGTGAAGAYEYAVSASRKRVVIVQ
jgi:hypothetical protein